MPPSETPPPQTPLPGPPSAADYAEYRPLMFSIAYRMTGSVGDAEDIVQDAFVRLTRAAVMVELGKDYVAASRMAGAGRARLMFLTVLPNCLAPLIVQASLGFSSAILDTAALGFLGLGAQPPTPEWGTMLADALQFVQSAWWVVTFPGLAILLTVLGFNLVGDGLRDALDPRLKRG